MQSDGTVHHVSDETVHFFSRYKGEFNVMKTVIQSAQAPAAIGPYSQAAAGNGIVCISGQLPIDPETGEMPQQLEEQVRQSMRNVLALTAAAGSSPQDILKCGLFIRDMKKFSAINQVYQEFFEQEPPARFVVEVSQLPKGAQIEIDAIAVCQ